MAISSISYSATNLGVNIEGVNGKLLENVRQSLSIYQKDQQSKNKVLSEKIIKNHHARAKKQISTALHPFGFYHPIITTSLHQQDNKKWVANYTIQVGPAIKISDIELIVEGQGKSESTLQTLIKKPSIKTGDQLNHQNYTAYKQALLNTLYDLGYLDVSFKKSELRVDTKSQEATIVLALKTGLKYYFGNIVIQQDSIHSKLIKQFITIDDNTPFNTDHLLSLQLRLVDSGYFSQIDIDVQRDKTEKQRIPVVITAKPSKKLKYSTSIGYGTDTGPRVGLSILNRRVNKRGHHLQYGLRLSPVDSDLSTKYVIPIGNIYTESLDFFATGNREVVNDIDSIQYNIGSSIHQNYWGGRQQLSLSFKQEDFSFDDEPDQTSTLFIPSVRYTRKKADNALFARRGYSFSANMHGGSEELLSDTTFIQGYINAKSVIPLGKKTRFLSRIELGAISTDSFNELPPSERFFTGGSQSVRGYRYKDIGDRNAEGNNIGGQNLLAGSIELDSLLYGNYGIAFFYDAGDAASNDNFSLKESAGFGFRYRSPIGMIRIDLAHPFDDPNEDVRLHVSIGPDL